VYSKAGGQQQLSVLVAEDHTPLRELIAAILNNAGYNVLTAASGDEALRIASESTVDLLLTDVRMPGLSADSLVDQFKEHAGNAGVVMMSGDLDAIKAQGRVQLLQKPFTSKSLLAVVSRGLGDRATKP
jgi:two-component system, cell cycle sensor histidine kinase and response regulator CckA